MATDIGVPLSLAADSEAQDLSADAEGPATGKTSGLCAMENRGILWTLAIRFSVLLLSSWILQDKYPGATSVMTAKTLNSPSPVFSVSSDTLLLLLKSLLSFWSVFNLLIIVFFFFYVDATTNQASYLQSSCSISSVDDTLLWAASWSHCMRVHTGKEHCGMTGVIFVFRQLLKSLLIGLMMVFMMQ